MCILWIFPDNVVSGPEYATICALYNSDGNVCRKSGLTTMPIVPWHGPPVARGPRSGCILISALAYRHYTVRLLCVNLCNVSCWVHCRPTWWENVLNASFTVQDDLIKRQNIIHRESKKQDTKLLAITSLNITRFSKFFTSRLGSKFATNLCLNIPPRIKHVATLPCEIWMQKNGIILKYVLQLMMYHKIV